MYSDLNVNINALRRTEARAKGTQSKEARAWCHIPVTAAAFVSCAHDTNLRHGKRLVSVCSNLLFFTILVINFGSKYGNLKI